MSIPITLYDDESEAFFDMPEKWVPDYPVLRTLYNILNKDGASEAHRFMGSLSSEGRVQFDSEVRAVVVRYHKAKEEGTWEDNPEEVEYRRIRQSKWN